MEQLSLLSNTVNLIEVSESLHGELPFVGSPCLILRTDRCNLKCAYCDVDTSRLARIYNVEEIVDLILSSKLSHILITGGEPLLFQQFWIKVITHKHLLNKKFTIETNGTIYPDIEYFLYYSTTIVFDWKLENPESFDKRILDRVRNTDVVKFVYNPQSNDLEKAFDLTFAYIKPLAIKPIVVFSPIIKDSNFCINNYKDDIQKIIQFQKKCYGLELKFQLQLHKIVQIS